MIFGINGIALIAPTTVDDNHKTAVAPATYVITCPLFSVSSHLSETDFTTSFASNLSAALTINDPDLLPFLLEVLNDCAYVVCCHKNERITDTHTHIRKNIIYILVYVINTIDATTPPPPPPPPPTTEFYYITPLQ